MNNRELATCLWATIGLVAILCNGDLRGALWAAVSATAQVKIVVPLALMTVYIAGLIGGAEAIGLWNGDMTGDTITWTIGTGTILFFASVQVFKPGGSFRRLVRKLIPITLFVEVFTNLYVFPLPVELLLLPFAALVTGMRTVAESDRQFADPGHQPLRSLLRKLEMTLGFVLLLWVSAHLVGDLPEVWRPGLERFALPVWLTVLTLPFVAALGAFASYDGAFSLIRWASPEPVQRMRARMALASELGPRVRYVSAIDGHWCKALTSAESLSEARVVARRFREATRASWRDKHLQTTVH